MSTGLIVVLVAVALCVLGVGLSMATYVVRRAALAPHITPPPGQAAQTGRNDRAYLDALAVIDPGLVSNEDRAISRAENTCFDIRQGDFTEQQLVDRVVTRLSGGDASITEQEAAQALTLMRRYICTG